MTTVPSPLREKVRMRGNEWERETDARHLNPLPEGERKKRSGTPTTVQSLSNGRMSAYFVDYLQGAATDSAKASYNGLVRGIVSMIFLAAERYFFSEIQKLRARYLPDALWYEVSQNLNFSTLNFALGSK